MGIFEGLGAGNSTIIRNECALDLEWIPKILPYREAQQRHIAGCIKPLIDGRNGKNLFVYGIPGIGKTAATRTLLKDLDSETDSVIPFYINCWQKNSTFKVFIELCHQLEFRFTQNKKTEELFDILEKKINQKAAVFVFDEIDKAEELDFLYTLMEKIYKKTIILITNYPSWIEQLDARIASRLLPELLEFKEYTKDEVRNILKQRVGSALTENSCDLNAFNLIVETTTEKKDIRCGLYLLRESALAAEEEGSRKIMTGHAQSAIQKLDAFTIKKPEVLENDTKLILDIIKKSPEESRIGDLFKLYQAQNGAGSYKTFQRKIDFLSKNNFIAIKKLAGGIEGNTTLVSANRKLSEF